jgi:glycerol-3-phosphate O-acyltransferase
MGPIENHSDEGWVMTDLDLMMRRRRMMFVIGGERVTTEKKLQVTTHDGRERHSTKTQGPSLTKRDDVVKKSESER